MSDVQFEENDLGTRPAMPGSFSQQTAPTLVRLVLKTGIVKEPKQANQVLIAIAICAFVLTLFVIKDMLG